ncbi:hypothetical protein C0V77_10075 [Emticicia sp. TH156]|nr:hypothetical protein C0V77_10075 [Emticicia sp. TH156]
MPELKPDSYLLTIRPTHWLKCLLRLHFCTTQEALLFLGYWGDESARFIPLNNNTLRQPVLLTTIAGNWYAAVIALKALPEYFFPPMQVADLTAGLCLPANDCP